MRKITVAITRTTIVEVLRTWIMPKVSHQDPNTWAVSAAADPELRFPTCGSPLSTLTPSETCVPLQETRVDASPVHKSEAPAGIGWYPLPPISDLDARQPRHGPGLEENIG